MLTFCKSKIEHIVPLILNFMVEKSKVATLAPSGSTATRTENPNAEEAENNDLKMIL